MRDKFAAASKIPDYVDVAARAKGICAHARRKAETHREEQQVCHVVSC